MKKLLVMGLAAMGLALTACNSDETVEVDGWGEFKDIIIPLK